MVHFYFLFGFFSSQKRENTRLTDANFECLAYFLLLLLFWKDIFLSSFTMNNAANPKMYILHFYSSCSFISLLGSHPFRGTCHIHGCLSVTRFWPSYRCHIHNKNFSRICYQIASFLLFDTFSHLAPRQDITRYYIPVSCQSDFSLLSSVLPLSFLFVCCFLLRKCCLWSLETE